MRHSWGFDSYKLKFLHRIYLKPNESYTFECFDSDEVAKNEQKCTLTAENGFVFHGSLNKLENVVTFQESFHSLSL